MKRLLDLFLRLRRRLLHLRDHAAAAEPGRTRSDAAHAAGHAVPAPAGPQRPAGGGADPLDALLDDLAAGADTELRALMCPLASDLDRLVAAVRQVQDHPRWGSAELSHVSVGRILKRLLETKFPGVVERVEGVLRFVGQHGAATWMEAAFVEFTATLHHRLAGLGPVFVRDIGEIAELARRCRDFAGRFDEEQRQGPVADVVARHVHNSEVWASGQIILQRGGCFYSRLWAGTGVTVESGVFRGEAATVSRGHVTMDEAGSPWGTEVRITILEDGVFKARRVHPGVHVVIGGAGCVFRTGARGVVVRPAGRELEVTAASWAEAGPGAGKRPGEGRRGAAAGTTAADPA